MAWRVSQEEVRALIDNDEDINFAPFIDTANALTDVVVSNDSDGDLTVATLKQIEMYLAAHFYEHRDPQYIEEKTGDASGKFQGEFGMALDSSKWGQSAKMFDSTGYLAGISKGKKKAVLGWLGLPPSEQTAYEDRD